ncbi:uncharacterized protein CANTADRAFT_44448 [Suhomyces tanzawaensis NRRL Y-17324]|uniref:Uncharacterized protein n=1 Tax=Suhomyces tanzawaensis NRRL Y-17324 TaxID=984487 RepID=A0A1E4SRU6_9ASCO|nr:uncharacterized protein CANTADRAFT_44448 [Suhomyces tanzawaensis NRRL Y-17324]ODV82239.1 hypothetical protein CANTADRAFT_44448 [Suhomyces tanzawaensis NRRL Y-17324]
MKLTLVAWLIVLVGAYQHYCWCKCNTKSLVRAIDKCGTCTKEFCLEEDMSLCEIEDPDGSKMARRELSIILQCFQVESFKETVIVYLFIAAVGSLLAYVLYLDYIKA